MSGLVKISISFIANNILNSEVDHKQFNDFQEVHTPPTVKYTIISSTIAALAVQSRLLASGHDAMIREKEMKEMKAL